LKQVVINGAIPPRYFRFHPSCSRSLEQNNL